MTGRGMGAESHTMVYNQHGIGADCSCDALEANYWDANDDDSPLDTKRKSTQCREANKRQKQMKPSRPTVLKDELAIDDVNIKILPRKGANMVFRSYHGLNRIVKDDEMMAVGGIPSMGDEKEIPYTSQYETTNMTLAPAAPTISGHEIFPEYILHFTNNNRQFMSRSEHEFSYDQHWSSWPTTISRMSHRHDPPATLSRSTHPSGYIRSPDIGQNTSTTPLAKYRIPSITITDTDPYGIRNPLYPGSINAVDKFQMAINEALFRPGSRAFDRSCYAGWQHRCN
ncbi:hypothetical protein ACJ72_00742 [Emergomyces africanus]|uniref:Uncharacterized protein n=1 Tax=Emergomyces africanus TaxID=1955775 RepID=A0A1B7P778_9EURO|nr:hypothetical protein ACJ72_00742 [Emergomyces africanus]